MPHRTVSETEQGHRKNMQNTDFISYLERLKPEDWQKMATDKWTVKDVVAHMVGWEKAITEIARSVWETKKEPWFMKESSYDDFNEESVSHYRTYSPEELIAEWKKWQEEIEKIIEEIGEDNLRNNSALSDWLFDEGDNSHYEHHYNQIRESVELGDKLR